jgi:simple sugar transport system substrate-binding protein/ribose transport system substrate-binding protein
MKKLLLTLLFFMLFGFIGCSRSEKTDSARGKKQASELTIAAITHVENQWATMLMTGYAKAAQEKGIKQLLRGNYDNDASRLIELLNTFTTQKVDGIMTNPHEASVQLLNSLGQQGIAIGTTNLLMDNLTESLISMAYSQYDLGHASVETALKVIDEKLNGKPHMGFISVRSGSVISDERDFGFLDGIKQVYPDAVIENQAYTLNTSEALQYATDMMTANPSLNIIFGASEAGVIGAVQAIRNMGRQGKVFVFGVDASEQMCQMLLDDDEVLWALGAQNSYDMGYRGMLLLIESILGERTITKGERIMMPVPPLTRGKTDDVKAFIDMLKSFS